MYIEEQLEEVILSRYKTIKDFSRKADIPYMTIRSILEKKGSGVSKANVQTIIKMFNVLDLDIESVPLGRLEFKIDKNHELDGSEMQLLKYFKELNEEGKNIILSNAKALGASGLYKKISDAQNSQMDIG